LNNTGLLSCCHSATTGHVYKAETETESSQSPVTKLNRCKCCLQLLSSSSSSSSSSSAV